MFAIKVGKVITPYENLENKYIIIDKEKGIIKSISNENNIKDIEIEEIHEYGDSIAIPGLIDIHIHGGYGIDIAEGRYEKLKNLSKILVKKGVTTFLPTIASMSIEDIKRCIDSVKRVIIESKESSEILGLHLEGRYISKIKKGAQPEEHISKPDFEEFLKMFEYSEGLLKRVTIAPEVEGAIEFIKDVSSLGVIVALGHTNATYEEASKGIDAGAKLTTHTFNGMRNFHHRDPGILAAILLRDDVMAEAIADLIHLHPATIRLMYKCKGSNGIVLVTDAVSATGLPDGEYTIGSQKIIVKDGISRLEDGTLAGSTITLDKAIKNMVEVIGIPLREAVMMATANPARIMKIKNKGVIAPFYDADIVIVDNKINVVATYKNGKCVYNMKNYL
jgi:N-acetylglucosamine-6-phosphate deacetylase